MFSAYFDAFSGLSGDMIVGALLDCGADFDRLQQALASLPVRGYRLAVERKTVSGISAAKFSVEVLEPQPERHLSEITAMIERSALDAAVKSQAGAIFACLAQAEAKVHHTTPEHVHFHEVGAVDSIVDIVATAWCLHELKIAQVLVSPLPMGQGMTRSQHGIIPVPPPATAELLTGFPVRLGDGSAEMVTPTGAAVLRTVAKPAALPLQYQIERIGYGAGTKRFEDRPNVLRVLVGRTVATYDADELIEIETNIDDLNPQIYDYLGERLYAAGARDVTYTPTIMKKGRPALIVSVLAEPAKREQLAAILFEETTTIGVRYHTVSRLKLRREIKSVDTRFGPIRIKLSSHGDNAATMTPEYDDCLRAAREHQVALKEVMFEAQNQARAQFKAQSQGH